MGLCAVGRLRRRVHDSLIARGPERSPCRNEKFFLHFKLTIYSPIIHIITRKKKKLITSLILNILSTFTF